MTSIQSNTFVIRMGLFSTLLLLSLSLGLTKANANDELSPQPAPTNAVQDNSKTWSVIGQSAADQPYAQARYAALLEAYKKLLVDRMSDGVINSQWSSSQTEAQLFIIDEDHPNPQLMAWLTYSKVIEERKKDGKVAIELQSPPIGELSSAVPAMRATTSKDVDDDGLPEVISIGYDGSIYIKKMGKASPQFTARSTSLSSFAMISAPSFFCVRAVLPIAIGSVESAGAGQTRIVIEIESLESVNGKLLGRASEQREVIVPTNNFQENISFILEEPPDFAHLMEPKIELRGKALSSNKITSLDIIQNGSFAWSSPPGLSVSALQFNLERNLEPGWNLFKLSATDAKGIKQERDVWLHQNSSSQSDQPQKKRAIIVTLDANLNKEELRNALEEKGFEPKAIFIQQNSETIASDLLKLIANSEDANDLLIYFECPSILGMLGDGKKLRIGQNTLSPTSLYKAIEAGGYKRVLGLIYSEPENYSAARERENAWSDTATFLERLGGGGKLFFANIESADSSLSKQRNRSRKRLLEAIVRAGGSDFNSIIDLEEPNNTVFRGWMFGRPIFESSTST